MTRATANSTVKARQRPTVADLRAMKGRRQLTMLRVETLEEAAAADEAGIDIVSVPPDLLLDQRYREAAPSLFTMPGGHFYDVGDTGDFLRWAFRLFKASADAVYCNGSYATIRRLTDEGIPVIGHVGLVPSRATWTGGFKAVGKDADSALGIVRAVRNLEAAGAIGAEIEIVPVEVARAISERTGLVLLSMGSGGGCDAQYLFADDVLGQNRGRVPRHSKVYRNFAAEFDRLQTERIAAFREYKHDVDTGRYPEERYLVHIEEKELRRFLAELPQAAGETD